MSILSDIKEKRMKGDYKEYVNPLCSNSNVKMIASNVLLTEIKEK